MGGLFGNSGTRGTGGDAGSAALGSNPGGGKPIVAGGFTDDGARPMPSFNDPVATENMRNLRLKLSSASGRTATNLTGTRPFVNNFLGNTG